MMKRALLLLLGVLGVFLVLAAAVSVAGDNSLQATCPPFVNCLPTPVPSGGFNPGDPDGDGIPNGIDLCPDQGGPSSNSGCPPGVAPPNATSAPNIAAPITLPTLPTSGECLLATRSAVGVNIRFEPSTSSRILGALDPTKTYHVIAMLSNAEGVWARIVPGWVSRGVVRLGGDCETVPKLDEPGATDPTPNRLSFPSGFGLMLDKGDAPGENTSQGYCSPRVGVDWTDADGSTDGIHFDFGVQTWCITLDGDAHGFGLFPPDPCTPAQSDAVCPEALTHWYVGFDERTRAPELFAWISSFFNGKVSRRDGSITTPTPAPDQIGVLPSVLLSWRFFPPDPCKQDDPGCHHQPINFAVNLSLVPPDPCKSVDSNCPGTPNLTISWMPGGFSINFSTPPDPDMPGGLSINLNPLLESGNGGYGVIGPAGPGPGGFSINFQPPPDPDFQGFGIDGVDGVNADVSINFTVPAL